MYKNNILKISGPRRDIPIDEIEKLLLDIGYLQDSEGTRHVIWRPGAELIEKYNKKKIKPPNFIPLSRGSQKSNNNAISQIGRSLNILNDKVLSEIFHKFLGRPSRREKKDLLNLDNSEIVWAPKWVTEELLNEIKNFDDFSDEAMFKKHFYIFYKPLASTYQDLSEDKFYNDILNLLNLKKNGHQILLRSIDESDVYLALQVMEPLWENEQEKNRSPFIGQDTLSESEEVKSEEVSENSTSSFVKFKKFINTNYDIFTSTILSELELPNTIANKEEVLYIINNIPKNKLETFIKRSFNIYNYNLIALANFLRKRNFKKEAINIINIL